MNTLKARLPVFRTLALLVMVLGTAALALAEQGGIRSVSAIIDERLVIEALITEDKGPEVLAYLRDTTKPGLLRARALDGIFKGAKPPLTKKYVALLDEALTDSAPEVFSTAIRLVGETREKSLVKRVLGVLEENVDWRIKVGAIRAARPWTRLSHMFFLQKALDSDNQTAIAEAVRSIAQLRVHELSPQEVERIAGFLAPKYFPHLRSAALSALEGWDRVDWEMLSALILDETAPESLRAYALDMTDDIAEAIRMRPPVLQEVVESESSLPLVWRAFSRMKNIAQNDPDFVGGVADFLSATPQYNVATQSMASFLRNNSMVVKYVSGSWAVKRRKR